EPAPSALCPCHGRSLAVRLLEQPPYRARELPHRDRPLELRLHAAVSTHEERPRFGAQTPLPHPAIVAERRAVPLVDLDVDEAHARAESAPDGFDDVDDRTAGAARAETRRREGDDERRVRRERSCDRVAEQR